MRSILLIAVFALTMIPAYAHLGSLFGIVHNGNTQMPLQDVTVVLKGTGRVAQTNVLGQYQFDNLAAAEYIVEFSHLSFKKRSITVQIKDDERMVLRTDLMTSQIELGEVTISSLEPHDHQLISGVDIKLRPINNSQEVLRMVPGLFIGQHAGGGKAEQIFLRGFDLDHGTDINLTVDGMPVNMVSHAHGQGYADLHFVIPEMIKAVDFKKGPYHADKGNFTTAGWVNLKTQDALEQSFVKLEAGQFDTFRAVAGIDLLGQKGRDRNQNAYLASEYSFSNSYFDHPQHFNRVNVMGKYHGHLTDNTVLTLTGSTFWSRWDASGQIPDRAYESGMIGFFGAIDPTEGGSTSRTNFNAETATVTSRNFVIKNQVFYSHYDFELFSNFTFFLEDPINGDQIRQKESRDLMGYNGSISQQHKVGSTQWTTTLGAQFRQDFVHHIGLAHTKNRNSILERYKYGNINEMNAALYLDEQIQVTNRLAINAGLRYDYFNNQYTDLLEDPSVRKSASEGILSPKLNFYYTFNPKLQLFLNTGKGFHSNDTRVVVAQNGRQILPAAYGSDLGLVVKPFPKMILNASLWYLWMAQEFVYVGDAGVVEPGGKTRRQGIDLSIRYQILKSLYADVDLSTAKPRALSAEAGSNYLPLAPIFTSTGGLSLQMKNGLTGSVRYRYMAQRPANDDYSVKAIGYFVNDLQLNKQWDRYTVGLSIQNLFNTKWKETQFDTESRLKNEAEPVSEIHFTPGTPFFAKVSVMYHF
ncbi:outer membrane receptor protein involved in Fe transport [Dyadobacter jejuensis]|uniref:Outer membrane receptor protein involved in Fe transport n=1 Tax=Dyadobacter jejuensis TaxID=1082580 RepID=A0A316AEB1_9BACT|nr:TonB-dependent receptor [Dyadobacter jejuensis]PWJ55942.1 outer membrane receptor protein involved in Fe transport [Dyadobacter jejuensis]